MRTIVIDARGYFTGGGIGRYTRHLIHELSQARGRNVDLRLLISNRHRASDIDVPGLMRRHITVSRATWLNQDEEDRSLPEEVSHADLFHSLTGHWIPASVPSIVTLHDLTPLVRPRLTGSEARLMGSRIAMSLPRARHVIAVSASTARDARMVFGGALPAVTVIPEGAAPVFRPLAPTASVLDHYRVRPDGFLFALSVLNPHKNLTRLVAAYQASGVTAPLLIAGAARESAAGVREMIRGRNLQGRVRLLGRLPDDDLAVLYRSCRAFIYPSLYEGFGLPVIEAMACGAPVIASNTSSLPELMGDAGLLVNPTRTDAIARAIRRVDSDLPLRSSLRTRALERARLYSWARTATATLDVYESLLRKARAA